MSEYTRIENMQDEDQVYTEIVKIFGKDIFLDQYRTVGAFLDIAPRMHEEASYLLKAFDAGIPQYLAKAVSLSRDKALDLSGKLTQSGIPRNAALDLLENLCHAVGIRTDIRPDYSRGGRIPYEAGKNDSLSDAVRKLDHIRWFLNNSEKYRMNGLEKELRDLRKMMNNPQKNETELVAGYEKLIHKFQNDPFAETFIFDKEMEADVRSSDFGAYFIIVSGTPVALEFARQYKGTDYINGLKSFRTKYEMMAKKIQRYHNEISAATLPSGQSAKTGKAVAFVVAAVLLLFFLRAWFFSRFQGYGLFHFWNVLKDNHMALWRVLAAIPSVSHPAGYAAVMIIYGLILLCVIILVINLCKTVRNIAVTGKRKTLGKKKRKLEYVFEKTIPDSLKSVMEKMHQYTAGKCKTLVLTKHNYHSSVCEIQNLKNVKSVKARRNLVTDGGKTALGWLIFFSIVLSIMSLTQLKAYVLASAADLGVVAERRQILSDTVIPKNAMEFAGHYYAIYDDAEGWQDAYNQCLKLGGHLATVSSAEEDGAIAGYMKSRDCSSAFLGLIYTSSDGYPQNWYWYGFEGLSYTDWTEGEPDIGSEQDCLYGAMGASDNYKWRALRADSTNFYICEWDSLEAGMKDERVLDIPIGSMNYSGHYYAILDGAKTYDDAVKKCSRLGGYLCMIDNEDENTAVYQYMQSRGYDSAYFGYSDQDTEGSWIWSLTGAPGEYTKWDEGEPNGDINENYGMFYSGSSEYCWNDGTWGGENSAFICEWDLSIPEE